MLMHENVARGSYECVNVIFDFYPIGFETMMLIMHLSACIEIIKGRQMTVNNRGSFTKE